MVHLKKIRVPANMNVVMGSIEELHEKRSHLQSTHTQTILKPRVRLRKVILLFLLMTSKLKYFSQR